SITTGFTGTYTLTGGQTNLTIGTASCRKTSLGDFVWNDVNANGIQDAGELGIAGATVQLYNATGTTVLATTTTDANGLYLFSNLTPGTYTVKFTTPGGYTPSPQDQGGNDAVDSDASITTGFTGTYSLTGGQTNL